MVYVTEFGKRDLIAQQLEQRYKLLNYFEMPKQAAQRQALYSSFYPVKAINGNGQSLILATTKWEMLELLHKVLTTTVLRRYGHYQNSTQNVVLQW